MTDQADPRTGHGSVAEEMAALAEALRRRVPRPGPSSGEPAAGQDPRHTAGRDRTSGDHDHRPGDRPGAAAGTIEACEICPVCRTIAALHTVSPGAVSALADLAHQAEVTLRALAVDLQRRESAPGEPDREDIPVEDLDRD